MTVFIAAVPGFVDHPKVANGASELLADVLGDLGAHARVSVGASSLPLGAPVEVAIVAAVAPGVARAYRAGARGKRRSPSRRVTP